VTGYGLAASGRRPAKQVAVVQTASNDHPRKDFGCRGTYLTEAFPWFGDDEADVARLAM
jgi:hypothetical protein